MCDASYTYWLFLIYIRAIRSFILCLRAIRAIRSSILCFRAIREIRSFVSLVFCLGGVVTSKTLTFLQQNPWNKGEKHVLWAGLQLTGNQNVIKRESKRGLLRVQKGVSKGLKGHLLEAKRALIRMELTPFYFSRFEFPLQYRGTKEDRRIKNKDYVFYCHKQLINSSTC